MRLIKWLLQILALLFKLLAGVSVRQGNAAPGENAQITIRGITSFQDGGSGHCML